METYGKCKLNFSTYYTTNAYGVESSFQLFQPLPFEMSHIPQPVPSIEGGYMPSIFHPIHSMSTQLGYIVFGVALPQSGGYNMN